MLQSCSSQAVTGCCQHQSAPPEDTEIRAAPPSAEEFRNPRATAPLGIDDDVTAVDAGSLASSLAAAVAAEAPVVQAPQSSGGGVHDGLTNGSQALQPRAAAAAAAQDAESSGATSQAESGGPSAGEAAVPTAAGPSSGAATRAAAASPPLSPASPALRPSGLRPFSANQKVVSWGPTEATSSLSLAIPRSKSAGAALAIPGSPQAVAAEAIASAEAVAARKLVPGAPVKLCGMRFAALNCVEGVVEQRADFGRRYTIRIEDLEDTITLPITDLQLDDEAPSPRSPGSPSSPGRWQRARSQTDITKVSDSDGRPVATALRRTGTLVRALSRRATEINLGEAFSRATSMAAVKSSLSRPLLGTWWAEKKQRAKEHLLEMSTPLRRQVLESVGDMMQDRSTQDPDLPPRLKTMLRGAVGAGWADVQFEIEESLDHSVHAYTRTLSELEERSRSAKGPTVRPSLAWLLPFRTFILFHYLPYNKSFFGKIKDPSYCIMTLLAMTTSFGVRLVFFSLILALLLFPWPPDEFQLINFILLFKGTQFFTSGVIGMLIGAMEYYYCFLMGRGGADVLACMEEHGPGTTEFVWSLLLDYLGSIALVWAAFLVLPMSHKFPRHGRTQRRWEERREDYCFCFSGVPSRGGRLRPLLRYDVCCFFLSWGIVVVVNIVVNIMSYQFDEVPTRSKYSRLVAAKAAIFWCRVIYALLSLPFAAFVIPVLSWLLTHTVHTGFNENGACVQFAYPSLKPTSEDEVLQ